MGKGVCFSDNLLQELAGLCLLGDAKSTGRGGTRCDGRQLLPSWCNSVIAGDRQGPEEIQMIIPRGASRINNSSQ